VGDVSEIQQAKQWIYDSLHADSYTASQVGTRIKDGYMPEPPADRTYPYILYDLLAAPARQGLGHNRLQTVGKFQIRAVVEGRPNAAARKLGKRIDDIFQNASNVPSGDYYFSSIQDQEVDRSEFDSATGKHYHNLGGIYDVFIGRTP
jgi:hypothetical protein